MTLGHACLVISPPSAGLADSPSGASSSPEEAQTGVGNYNGRTARGRLQDEKEAGGATLPDTSRGTAPTASPPLHAGRARGAQLSDLRAHQRGLPPPGRLRRWPGRTEATASRSPPA
jgi:hypothetical protein